jgi:predicted phosphodiesterase
VTKKTLDWFAERDSIALLQERGYRVEKAPKVPQDQAIVIREKANPGTVVKLGILSDEHLCSKYQQLSALRDFFAFGDNQGVDAYVSGGDTCDGDRMHKDHMLEVFVHGSTAQVEYVAEHYPKPAAPLYRIDGNHDYSHYNSSGHIFGQSLQEKRPELRFVGYAGGIVKIGAASIYVMHGDGGVAYARSYKMQRIAEQLDLEQRGIDIFALGHYHVSGHLPRYRGLNCLMLPCFQSQTPYLRRKGLMPDIGGVIMEIEFGRKGAIRDVQVRWRLYEPKVKDY